VVYISWSGSKAVKSTAKSAGAEYSMDTVFGTGTFSRTLYCLAARPADIHHNTKMLFCKTVWAGMLHVRQYPQFCSLGQCRFAKRLAA